MAKIVQCFEKSTPFVWGIGGDWGRTNVNEKKMEAHCIDVV